MFFPTHSVPRERSGIAGLYKLIYEEYERTEKYLLKLTRHESLMGDYPQMLYPLIPGSA
jgi:phosphoenolpyruvate carboxylase